MLIAREKKKENIAEYILYMWYLEDLLRGLDLDINKVNKQVIASYNVDEATAKEIYDWYDNLIEMMKREHLEKSGHLQVVKNNVDELTELHRFLLQKAGDPLYRQLVMTASANLADFRVLSSAVEYVSDAELALNALYADLLLKLQRKEISASTHQAMETFSKMIAYLSSKYKQIEEEN
ncbi:MAG: DUF4924 family protein [Culturomica sp.]|jgi:hypothetical protein|nr:DUF4924 family protein [Culturomica sp.]